MPKTPMPYVPAAAARSGANDFAGAVAARAAQQAARKEADALANIGTNQAIKKGNLPKNTNSNSVGQTQKPVQQVNNPTKPRPTTRHELRKELEAQGFRRTGSNTAQYETWKGPNGVKIDIRPNGEVIRTQRVWRTDGVQGKYPQRQDYYGNPLPNNNHNSGYFVE